VHGYNHLTRRIELWIEKRDALHIIGGKIALSVLLYQINLTEITKTKHFILQKQQLMCNFATEILIYEQ
jgi:hypothetical protein